MNKSTPTSSEVPNSHKKKFKLNIFSVFGHPSNNWNALLHLTPIIDVILKNDIKLSTIIENIIGQFGSPTSHIWIGKTGSFINSKFSILFDRPNYKLSSAIKEATLELDLWFFLKPPVCKYPVAASIANINLTQPIKSTSNPTWNWISISTLMAKPTLPYRISDNKRHFCLVIGLPLSMALDHSQLNY